MIKRIALAFALTSALAGATTVQPLIQPHVTFVDAAGLPCVGCKLYSYVAGTTTPLATYTDSTAGTQNTNPITLDTAGGGEIWVLATAYKFTLKDTSGGTIWTVDNVIPSSGGGGGGSVVSFAAAAISWPTWLVPSVTNSTTTPALSATVPSQAANVVLASPSGSTGTMNPRALVLADMPAGLATVTSVALTVPAWLSVGGSPVTTAGTLAVTANSQSANLFLASPSGSSGAPTFRAMTTADLPATVKANQFQTNTEFSNGTCTTAKTIDPVNGNKQKVTLTDAATCALTFTQPGAGTSTVQLRITQSAAGAFSGGISGCLWPGGVVPTITQTSAAIDMLSVYLDGTNAYCQIAQAFN